VRHCVMICSAAPAPARGMELTIIVLSRR
jgi:hypothetical protein